MCVCARARVYFVRVKLCFFRKKKKNQIVRKNPEENNTCPALIFVALDARNTLEELCVIPRQVGKSRVVSHIVLHVLLFRILATCEKDSGRLE